MKRMKIEIWSDVMCPFCYIGKRRFERSLSNSSLNDQVEVEWKSYQLNPSMETDPTRTINDYLAEHRGVTLTQAEAMNTQVTAMAAEEGLEYNLANAKVANSFKAHILAHYAKQFGKMDEVEELLFRNYFTDNKNIDDIEVLKAIAIEAELDVNGFIAKLVSGELDDEVKMDMHEARQIGVKGVPFFVYDRKYGVSGAQPLELFEQTLTKAFEEWQQSGGTIELQNNADESSCHIDGNCN